MNNVLHIRRTAVVKRHRCNAASSWAMKKPSFVLLKMNPLIIICITAMVSSRLASFARYLVRCPRSFCAYIDATTTTTVLISIVFVFFFTQFSLLRYACAFYFAHCFFSLRWKLGPCTRVDRAPARIRYHGVLWRNDGRVLRFRLDRVLRVRATTKIERE